MSAAEAKENKPEKKAKKAAEAPAAAAPAAPAPAPPPAAPRPPADPRLKVLKKFEGRFLPKGVLRVRYNGIMDRWNADGTRDSVSLDELKSLHADWKGTREKPPRIPKA